MPPWKSMAAVLLNHWGLSEKPSQKHQGFDVCYWLFIVQHCCPVAAFSFYPVLGSEAAPLLSPTDALLLRTAIPPHPPLPLSTLHIHLPSFISIKQPNNCMDFIAVGNMMPKYCLLSGPITKEGLGWQGAAGTIHSYLTDIPAWVGNKRRESQADKHR